jgi:hypothetical protein
LKNVVPKLAFDALNLLIVLDPIIDPLMLVCKINSDPETYDSVYAVLFAFL